MPDTNNRQNRTIAHFLEKSRQHLGLLGSLLMAGSIGTAQGSAAIANEEAEAPPAMERRTEGTPPSTGLPARHPVERMP